MESFIRNDRGIFTSFLVLSWFLFGPETIYFGPRILYFGPGIVLSLMESFIRNDRVMFGPLFGPFLVPKSYILAMESYILAMASYILAMES